MTRILLQAESPGPSSANPARIRTLLIAILIIFILSSCETPESIPAPIVEPVPVIASQDEKLRQEIAYLKKLLVEKDELIKNQKIRQQDQAKALQEVNKEAVRAQVKLHRLATKPSTASAIAETEVALAHLKQIKIPAADQILLIQAQQLTETASTLFLNDQYASAMNYVAQAKHLIELITNPNRKKESNGNSMLLEFHTPIKLHTKANVNLRNAPNTQSRIISTLKKATEVTANASQGAWLRVQVNQNQGWVLNTGLETEKN